MKEEELKIKKEDFVCYKKTPISKEYTLGKEIGKGAFGLVRLGVQKSTHQVRAVKITRKNKNNVKNLIEEVNILSKLTHPNIMQIYEVFDDITNFYIVSEYCKGGELFETIEKKGSFSEKDAATIMKQLLSAVCYSHQNNIVHRDLKPENILLDNKSDDLVIKLIDWGCAKKFTKEEKLHTSDGTCYYIAPEVLEGNYDEKCDIWSCGVIMYILLCGYPPFNGENDDEIFNEVLKANLTFPDEEWESVSNEAKELIKKMLTKDPQKRISALDALGIDWFKKYQDKSAPDNNLAQNVLQNMKKFKKGRKLEQATVSFIINQLISKDERKELLKQFQEWDTNGDGVLSKEEIIEGYKKAYGYADENEIENMIKSVDLDGNGVIDYNEFLSCAINKEKILSKKNLQLCFEAFDLDNSGSISLDELLHIFKMSDKKKSDVEVFKKMLKEADTNGDGEISFFEFENIMSNFFN